MTNPSTMTLQLRSGIEAARTGRAEEARQHLQAVLAQSPDHLPALFWLAYVAETPQESVRLLERVLAIEPDNARAQAGLRWARQRQQAQQPPAPKPAEAVEESLRKRLLSRKELQERGQKGTLAHRARRSIDPLRVVVIVLAAVALLGLGAWSLALVPHETLAAWLPLSGPNMSLAPAAEATNFTEVPVAAKPAGRQAKNFASMGDTIIPFDAPAPAPEPLSLLPEEAAPETLNPPAQPAEASEAAAPAPVDLMGPAQDLLTGPRLFEPVDEALLAHQPATSDEKWIEVNLTEQRVTAWEGNVPVMSFITSTGLPNTPTVQGKFNIYWKLESTLMTGPGYYLPEVPYTMYFYGGYALHGTYWHSNFGQPMSHGCVNLETSNAKALFEWAGPVVPPGQTQVVASADNPGTLVVVHE